MVYLTEFTLPSQGEQALALEKAKKKRTCYNNSYPFGLFATWEQEILCFEPITILYGGNGSGKTTLLQLIAECLELPRHSPHNRTPFFSVYAQNCRYRLAQKLPPDSAVLTSDDVFDDLLNLRSLNQGIDLAREELLREYRDLREGGFQLQSLEDYDQLKKVIAAKRKHSSGSDYVRRELGGNVRGRSNGETAFRYFTDRLQQPGLYLLDEPENSLSARHQQELADFLTDSARFFGCQLILSTHSPFLLAMKGAAVYDLTEQPIQQRAWTQLTMVRQYYDFFCAHSREFARADPEDGEDA